MIIKEITEMEEWEKFLLSQEYAVFVQSWNYGLFYKSMGEKFWVFGIYENNLLIGGSLVLTVSAKRGNFLYLPYGPILDYSRPELLKEFTSFLINFAKKQKIDFIRMSPFLDDSRDNQKLFRKLKYRSAPMHILAETTWILNLKNKKEEDLFIEMEKNHRNLIRKCLKENIKVECLDTEEAISNFNKLHDETAKRHNFHRFSKDYIKKEFKAMHNGDAKIFNAYLPDGRLDSSAIIFYYGNTAVYRHGASLLQDKKIPTSYLIQWEAIKFAIEKKMIWYNFWGIAPTDSSKKHPFWGITHFKKGFGGQQKQLLHCQDLPITKKYWLNWLVETIRKFKRGF